jgi:hypothetical protein
VKFQVKRRAGIGGLSLPIRTVHPFESEYKPYLTGGTTGAGGTELAT